MHAVSVPVFGRYLGQLAHIVALAEAHASREGIDPERLLQARLAADMLPFAAQVDIAAQFSLRACAPLAGLEVPAFGGFSLSFAALQERIGRSSAFLAALTAAQMQGSEHRVVSDPAGQATVNLAGREFVLHYALPNFFFHLSTAHAILRHAGVALGKADFDGFHVYAELLSAPRR